MSCRRLATGTDVEEGSEYFEQNRRYMVIMLTAI